MSVHLRIATRNSFRSAAGSSIYHCGSFFAFLYPNGTVADTRSPRSRLFCQTARIFLDVCRAYQAYTTFPDYTIKSKKDVAYLGRFNFDMLKRFEALTRVFTILARGYMWETDETDVDLARRALCAWCSMPESIKPKTKKEGQDKTCYADLHDEFPELVSEDGAGWFYNHVHNVIDTILDNNDKVYPTSVKSAITLTKKFDAAWCKQILHYQASLYSRNTKGWVRRFEDIIAEAKEEGRLQNKDFDLPAETVQKLRNSLIDKMRESVIVLLAKYYLANNPEDSDWVILPVDSFNAYFGTTSFDGKWLPMFPEEIIVRKDYAGICRYRMFI